MSTARHLPSTVRSPVYKKPKVEKFGSFRELTQFGNAGANDILAQIGIGDGNCWDTRWGTNCPAQPTAS
jgi:hypothetical protein